MKQSVLQIFFIWLPQSQPALEENSSLFQVSKRDSDSWIVAFLLDASPVVVNLTRESRLFSQSILIILELTITVWSRLPIEEAAKWR